MTVIITMCHCGWKLIFLLNVSRPEPYTPMWSDTTQCCPIPMLGVTRTHELRNLIKNLQSGCYRLPWSGDLFLLVLQTTSCCVQIHIVEADWTFLPVHLDYKLGRDEHKLPAEQPPRLPSQVTSHLSSKRQQTGNCKPKPGGSRKNQNDCSDCCNPSHGKCS